MHHDLRYFFCYPVAVVGFAQDSLNVSEGSGNVTLRVELASGSLQRDLTLGIQLINQSASGKRLKTLLRTTNKNRL